MDKNWRDISYLQCGNERQRRAFESITSLGICTLMAQFDPVLVSTICLAIDTPESDLDFICYAPDLVAFDFRLQECFGHQPGFNRRSRGPPQERVVATFEYRDFMYEVFGVPILVEDQPAFNHLIQTARLLSIGGDRMRLKIMRLKEAGTKTEPAIASILGFHGDPYQAVLSLAALSDIEMEDLVRKAI